jgi:DNA replication protein DnaC
VLRRLDTVELLILDDIGYIKQSAEEPEMLFTLIAQRYERHSVMDAFGVG